jgi:hypothetical protein
MKRFLQKLLLFSVPFWIYGLLIYCTDPFDFLGGPPLISEQVKARTANPLNLLIRIMPEFARHPSPNVLLGDSRMYGLKTERVKRLTGTDYFNLAVGGATIREIVELFWFASRHAELKHVKIGINFNLYTDYEQIDRTAEVLTIERDPLFYFINRTVLKAAMTGISAQLTNYDPKLGAVTVDQESFWRGMIDVETPRVCQRHIYPRKYHGELEKIGAYCKEHGIELVFVIFPTNVELPEKYMSLGMEAEYARYKGDLAAIAPTFDFDYPNDLTRDKANFSDPYHCKEECVDQVIREVWTGNLKYARLLP